MAENQPTEPLLHNSSLMSLRAHIVTLGNPVNHAGSLAGENPTDADKNPPEDFEQLRKRYAEEVDQ